MNEQQIKQADEVHLKTSTLATMANYLMNESDLLKRDFANIALLTMLRAYVVELDAIQESKLAMNAKVARWYRATRNYVERISLAQGYVESGLPFSLTVTREGWLLIITEGLPMLISGPKASDTSISIAVKAEYCRYHDCSWLTADKLVFAEEQTSVLAKQETWVFQQQQNPAFEIDRQFQFMFSDFREKRLKQAVSRRAVVEIKEFLRELKKAKVRGYFINWELMSQEVPVAGVDQTVFFNTGDIYLRLTLPLLGHLTISDWQHLMNWLKWSLGGEQTSLLIKEADSLLKAGRMAIKN